MSWGTQLYNPAPSAGSSWQDWASQQPAGLNPLYDPATGQGWWGSSPYGYEPTYGGSDSYLPSYGAGDVYRPASTYSHQILEQIANNYAVTQHPELFAPPGSSQPNEPYYAGFASPEKSSWAGINAWDAYLHQYIATVAANTGVVVPGNVVKAYMRTINPNGIETMQGLGSGYGPLGVRTSYPGADISNTGWETQHAANDPNYALFAGITALAFAYQGAHKQNGDYGWNNAASRILNGAYVPEGDSRQVDEFSQHLSDLDKLTQVQPGGGGYTPQGNTQQFTSIWGGSEMPTTQEFGLTEFGAANAAGMYKYVTDYGLPAGSHAGVDVGTPDGTRLYSPVSGTVSIAGGQPYYMDTRFAPGGVSQPHTGELLLTLANGDQLILGHMSQIGVNVGDTIQAGQYVGTSGYDNGAHVHVEYRRQGGNTPSGFTAIDPRLALSGQFSGVYTGSPSNPQLGQPGYGGLPSTLGNPTWQNYMIAAAQGQPIAIGAGEHMPTGTFQDFVLQQMGVLKAPSETAPPSRQLPGYVGGKLSNAGGSWATLDSMNAQIQGAVNQVYKETGIQVPANLIKGMIAREGSYGSDTGPGHVVGLRGDQIYAFNGVFQGTADSWGIDFKRMVNDTGYAIYATAKILGGLYRQQGGQYGWEGAAATYFGGSPTNPFVDENGLSTNKYLYDDNGVVKHWHYLDQLASQGQ